MRLVTFKLPDAVVNLIDEIVEKSGVYSSRSEYIRLAVLEKLRRERMLDNRVEIKIAMPTELYEITARKCREEGGMQIEECILTVLEHFMTGKTCELCATLDTITYREKMKELLCHQNA